MAHPCRKEKKYSVVLAIIHSQELFRWNRGLLRRKPESLINRLRWLSICLSLLNILQSSTRRSHRRKKWNFNQLASLSLKQQCLKVQMTIILLKYISNCKMPRITLAQKYEFISKTMRTTSFVVKCSNLVQFLTFYKKLRSGAYDKWSIGNYASLSYAVNVFVK